MKIVTLFLSFLIIFGLLAVASANHQTTIKLENTNIMGIGNISSTNITADILPTGLSGYNITISISNSSIAEIESIEFPSWATLHVNSTLPSNSAWIKAVDLNKKIEANATNVTLVTINIKSEHEGNAFINISITKLDDDNGYPIEVITKNATVNVFVNHPPNKPTLNAPSSGYTGDAITFSAKASDENGDKIKYGFDWNNDGTADEWTNYYASGTTASISHVWNNEGTYSIKVIAEDEHGMKSEWSNVVTITITRYTPPSPNQAPTITITSPLNGSTVNGTITIKGTASDDNNVVKVEIRIDGKQWIQTVGTTSWNYNVDTTTLGNGMHTIEARSYDGSLYSNIASISLNVFNNHKPSIYIKEPENGKVVNGIIMIKGIAIDSDGNETITKVEIKIDNETWNVVNGTTSWSYSWNTTTVDNGDYVIKARAYDGHDYSNIVSITVKVNNKKTPGFEIMLLFIALAGVLWMRKRLK